MSAFTFWILVITIILAFVAGGPVVGLLWLILLAVVKI